MAVPAFNPSTGMVGRGETGVSLANQSSLTGKLQAPVEDPSQKQKDNDNGGGTPRVVLWPPYTCTPISRHKMKSPHMDTLGDVAL